MPSLAEHDWSVFYVRVFLFLLQGKIALLLDMLHNANATVENEQEDATIKEMEGMESIVYMSTSWWRTFYLQSCTDSFEVILLETLRR